MKMPWGKFKGKEIHQLPSSYLKWISEKVEEDTDFKRLLVKEADEEYQWRDKNNQHWEE